MSISETTTVGELVNRFPQATRVLEKVGIDYCCGGKRTLAEACAAAKLPVAVVVNFLEFAREEAGAKQEDPNWSSERLGDLIDHLVGTHHKYTREATARVSPLLTTIVNVHGGHHPELSEIREVFTEMAERMACHMDREESVLFPFIRNIENGKKEGGAGVVENDVTSPINEMTHDHEWVGTALKSMRKASSNYLVPPDGCASYRALYQAMDELERDLHQHIHLENNILFPRAIEQYQARNEQGRPAAEAHEAASSREPSESCSVCG